MHNSAAATDQAKTTRQAILEEALKSFADRGFDGATLRPIADAAGVNVGLIKYYFDTKEQLWRESVGLAFARLSSSIEDTLPDLVDLDPEDQMRFLVRRIMRFISVTPDFSRVMNDEGKRDTERMRWLVDTHIRPLYDRIEMMIRVLQERGTLRADIHPAQFVYHGIGAMTLLFSQAPECRYMTGFDPTSEEALEKHIDLMLESVLLRGTLGGRENGE